MKIPFKKTVVTGILITLPFSCTPAPAHADEIIFSTRSYHLYVPNHDLYQQETNNNNWGIHYIDDNGFTTGAYYNSFYQPSVLLGYSFPLYNSIGMSVGVVSGYGKPIYQNPFFALNYHQKIDKNWSVVYTAGALVVLNVGLAYKF